MKRLMGPRNVRKQSIQHGSAQERGKSQLRRFVCERVASRLPKSATCEVRALMAVSVGEEPSSTARRNVRCSYEHLARTVRQAVLIGTGSASASTEIAVATLSSACCGLRDRELSSIPLFSFTDFLPR